MSVIILLLAAGAAVAGGFLLAFLWAVRAGQFDDTCTPAIRLLLDDRDDGGRVSDPKPPAASSLPR